MSTEIGDQSFSGASESTIELLQKSQKRPRFRYSKDFLLSISKLDICKKLPSGIDESILSEFEDAPIASFEQQKSSGSSYFQNPKRIEYGIIQSNRVDGSNNYSRGGHGRWDTRSSGSSDREDLQADCEFDSGRRYLNPSRRSWQQPEHDGLLGKPSGYSGQASAQTARGNSSYHLNKTTEPYQPPRSYKAVPYSRGNTDSFNDETFGTSECSTQDRAEEEKRRRASFELMRKEQHKALQEKQKHFPDKKHKDILDSDVAALLENSEKTQSVGSKIDKRSEDNAQQAVLQQSDTSKSSFQSQAPASRPLVPPGFQSTAVEKKHFAPSWHTSSEVEMEKSNDKFPTKIADGINSISEKDANGKAIVSSTLDIEIPVSSSNYLSFNPPEILEGTEDWKDAIIHDSPGKEVASTGAAKVSQHNSTSILDKLFQTALTRKDGGLSDFIQPHGLKADEETRNPSSSLSSKFAYLFLENQKKHVEDFSSADLLRVVVGNDKDEHQASTIVDENVMDFPSDFPIEQNEISQADNSSGVGTQEPHYLTSKPAESSDMLTCEQLEQLMLAEANMEKSRLYCSVPEYCDRLDVISKSQQNHVNEHASQQNYVNDNASQHLLSLLQKGTNLKASTLLVVENSTISSENLGFSDMKASHSESAIHNASDEIAGRVHSAENSLTLEALFGTAFMKELQSAEAPVSAQRGSASGSVKTIVQQPQELPFSDTVASVNGLFSSMTRSYSSHLSDETSMADYKIQEAKSCRDQELWTGPETLQSEGSNSVHVGNLMSGATDVHLPEEENLIAVSDTMDPVNTEYFAAENEANHEVLPSNIQDNIVHKFAALNSILINQRFPLPLIDGPHPVRGLHDQRNLDTPYHQLHGGPSSSQYPQSQINHARPTFQQLDPHAQINTQMFIGPNNIHHDPHHPYPTNMIQHHSFNNNGGPRFDPASHFQMLQHMPLPGNFLPQQAHDYPRGMPPSHLSNQVPRYIHEMNQMNPIHASPLNHRQAGYGGIGVPGPGNGNGVNLPESLENLIGMERAAYSRQNQLVAGGRSGIYGPGIEMGLRFR